jgi:hypothetical protein
LLLFQWCTNSYTYLHCLSPLPLAAASFALVRQMTCTFSIAEEIRGQALTLHLVLCRVVSLNAQIPAFFHRRRALDLCFGLEQTGGVLRHAVEAAGFWRTRRAFAVAFEHAVDALSVAFLHEGGVFRHTHLAAQTVGFLEAFALAGMAGKGAIAITFVEDFLLSFRVANIAALYRVSLCAFPLAILVNK